MRNSVIKNTILFTALFTGLSFTGGNITLKQTIPAKADQLTTDNLGNFYLVKNDVLEKYDPAGTIVKTYSNKSFGKIDLVDAGNAMKVLLFYKNFSEVVFLDNTLSLNGEPVSLESLGFNQTQLICSSYNNGTWIYNPQNFELLRLDQNLQQTVSTGNIAQLTGNSISPSFVNEYNNKVYLSDPEKGIMVFDVYGTYSKTIPLKKVERFQVSGDNIIYIQRRQIMSFNTKTRNEDSIPLPDTSATALRVEKERLFLLTKENLRIYKVKE
jgi:hypothetical protein